METDNIIQYYNFIIIFHQIVDDKFPKQRPQGHTHQNIKMGIKDNSQICIMLLALFQCLFLIRKSFWLWIAKNGNFLFLVLTFILLFITHFYLIINIYSIILTFTMNRHNWTFEEDEQLKKVVQTNGSQDWTKNAELLRQISDTAFEKKRTGKQCRQRWYNHLDPHVIKTQWTTEQEIKLFEMHKIHGNRWKQLTKYLPGRTDNDIKNHFYSTLRRSLRRLNKYIGQKNSTSQMRQIKPSVLTFIINHIYGHEIKQNANKQLINSLKQLPELIFKFSSFKPVKQNMDKKIDQSVREKIVAILHLVDQFKKLYNKQKIEDQQMTQARKKKKNNFANIYSNQNTSNMQAENDDNDENGQFQNPISSSSQLKHQYIQQDYVSDHLNYDKFIIEGGLKNQQREFSPIVTIQRKPSNFDQKGSKKLILIPKTEQKIQQNNKMELQNYHIRTLSIEDAEELVDNQMMPLQEPSMSVNENSHLFGDLVIIGKHIDPVQYNGTQQDQSNFVQIDEVLYENYQK